MRHERRMPIPTGIGNRPQPGTLQPVEGGRDVKPGDFLTKVPKWAVKYQDFAASDNEPWLVRYEGKLYIVYPSGAIRYQGRA